MTRKGSQVQVLYVPFRDQHQLRCRRDPKAAIRDLGSQVESQSGASEISGVSGATAITSLRGPNVRAEPAYGDMSRRLGSLRLGFSFRRRGATSRRTRLLRVREPDREGRGQRDDGDGDPKGDRRPAGSGGNIGFTPRFRQDVRRSSPGLDRVATSAGATAIRLATTRTPATSTPMSQIGTTESETTPRLLANVRHTARPTTTPSGTPMTIPTRANVVACHATADTT